MFKHDLIKRSVVSGLAIGAAAFPSAAQAMFINGGGGGPVVTTSAPAAASSVRQPAPSEGFEWGDAGIGAAGAVVLLGGAAAGVGVTYRRRTQRRIAA